MNKIKTMIFLSTLVAAFNMPAMISESLSIRLVTGKDIISVLPFIAKSRIEAFREYPYLYHGTMESESPYLVLYSSWKDTAVALVYADDTPVGFISGMPLIKFDEHCPSIEVFKKENLAPESCYYFPEVIILPEYQSLGLSEKLFEVLEAHAYSLGYRTLALLTSNRADTDPQKPAGYKSQDYLWKKLGYKKSRMIVSISWDTIQPDGTIKEQQNDLTYWFKRAR